MAHIVQVRIALGADLTADPGGWVWTDITDKVLFQSGIAIGRGGADEFTSDRPTQLRLRLLNTDYRFSFRNPTSTYWPGWRRNTPIQVRVDPGTGTYVSRCLAYVDDARLGWAGDGARVPIVDVTASGLLRRLAQGAPLRSPLYRALTGDAVQPVAYWPCEEESGANRALSPTPGVGPLKTDGVITFAGDSDVAGSLPLLTIGSIAGVRGDVPAYTASTEWAVRVTTRAPTAPGVNARLFDVRTKGTFARWSLVLVPGSPDLIRAEAWDTAGVEQLAHAGVDFVDVAGAELYGAQLYVEFNAVQDGGSIDWDFTVWHAGGSVSASGTEAGTIGNVHMIYVQTVDGTGALAGMTMGHIAVAPDVTYAGGAIAAATGFAPEADFSRFSRLLQEEGLAAFALPSSSVLETQNNYVYLGEQQSEDLLTLLRQARDAGQAMMWETAAGLVLYRTRFARYNNDVDLALDYDEGHLFVLQPTEDDQQVRNDATASRIDGGSGRYLHPMVDPTHDDYDPSVPVYADRVSLNLDDDNVLRQHAAWRVHLGTVDEPRYPQLGIHLHRHTALQSEFVVLSPGARITVANPPPELGPDPLDVYAVGTQEYIDRKVWAIVFNTLPASAWDVFEVEHPTLGRLAPVGATLNATITNSATSLAVATPAGYPLWVVSSDATRITDTYDRTTANGWGQADSGQFWTTSGGSASDYSVAPGEGKHSVGVLNSTRITFIGGSIVDSYVRWQVTIPVLAIGAPINASVITRRADSSNYYFFTAAVTGTNTVTASITKRVAGVETSLGSVTVPGLTHVAGTTYQAVCETRGTLLRVRVWQDGDDEPITTWHVEVLDSDLTAAGSVGLRSILTTGNTNSLPVVLSYSDFKRVTDLPFDLNIGGERMTVTAISGSTSPQTFTVTRSVNGVVKAHTAGDAVTLWKPGVWAL